MCDNVYAVGTVCLQFDITNVVEVEEVEVQTQPLSLLVSAQFRTMHQALPL